MHLQLLIECNWHTTVVVVVVIFGLQDQSRGKALVPACDNIRTAFVVAAQTSIEMQRRRYWTAGRPLFQ